MFEQQKARLAAEIVYRERMLHRLEQIRKETQDCVEPSGRYRLEYRPAFRFLPFCDGLKSGDKSIKNMGKEWSEHLALSSIFLIYRPDLSTGQYSSGISLEKDALYSCAAEDLPYTEELPSRLCVVTSLEGTYTRMMQVSDFSGALAFLQEHHYQLTGEVTAKVVYSLKKDGEYHFWHKVWFPIDQPEA